MPLKKRVLPKEADERYRVAIDNDLSAAQALYKAADHKVELAKDRFCARLEAAHWSRYQYALKKMKEPISYYEWLIKSHRLVETYSAWSSEQVHLHFAGLHAEAQLPKFRKRGEGELDKYWYMEGFNTQLKKRGESEGYGVLAKVITIESKFFVEYVPTIQYDSVAA